MRICSAQMPLPAQLLLATTFANLVLALPYEA